jgi:hypothetical protein
MSESLNFGVDPKLAALLGSSYRSTEQAIKELVDNAWDADASEVRITLPAEMSADPVIIEDDGSGMTVGELREDYLKVARDRRSLKGDLTVGKRRRVKGRKGIGKFAGLMVADTMQLVTSARGVRAELMFEREHLIHSHSDFERVRIPLLEKVCSEDDHGTAVSLSNLNRRLSHPNPEKLKRLLLSDYGRNEDFKVFVNGDQATLNDIPGEQHKENQTLPAIGEVKLSFAIAERKQGLKDSGIIVRVNGKPVGDPSYFGLDEMEDVPQDLLKRVYGEVDADGLLDDVTADWGCIVENSLGYSELKSYVQTVIKERLENAFTREFNLLHGRIKQQIDSRLSKLPEHKRDYAQAALKRVIRKFYGDSEDKIHAVVSVFLDALERDEYWEIIKAVHHAEQGDIQKFADALMAFGLLELIMVGRQAKGRIDLLDALDKLIANENTQEKQIHQVFEYNLWLLGVEHALLSSNRSMKNVVETFGKDKYSGQNAAKRPDLLLLTSLNGRFLLIEFKRPSKTISRDDENQAEKYRDELMLKFHPMDIMMIGGVIDSQLRLKPGNDIRYHTYSDVCARSRAEIDWLIKSLAEPRDFKLHLEV